MCFLLNENILVYHETLLVKEKRAKLSAVVQELKEIVPSRQNEGLLIPPNNATKRNLYTRVLHLPAVVFEASVALHLDRKR